MDQDHLVPAIDCTDFVLFVEDLVDSEPGQWAAVVTKHLRDCPPCLIYLQQMRDIRILLNHVFDGERLTEVHIGGVLNALTGFREVH